MSKLAVSRASELGRFGVHLLKWLPKGFYSFEQKSLSAQFETLQIYEHTRKYRAAVALSVLCGAVVLQVGLPDRLVLYIADLSLAPLPPAPKPLFLGKRSDGKGPFAYKPITHATKKVQLSFGDVYRDCRRMDSSFADAFAQFSGHLSGVTDDVACAAIMAAFALRRQTAGVSIAIRMAIDPNGAKILSSVLKSLGANGSLIGSLLVEGNTLQGRGVGGLDLRASAMERVGPAGTAGSLPSVGKEELTHAVRAILAEELPMGRLDFESTKDFWEKRWVWCVNGGHSRSIEKHDPRWAVPAPGRLHRRAVMESWEDNPLDYWDSKTFVSASVKQEHGKDRMILACDTASYVCFEHLMSAVDKAWHNKKVVLDPGKYGHYGMVERVKKLGPFREGFWVMLDYDDFNSQHTLESQALVIEETARHVGYDAALTDRLVRSFENMWIYEAGDLLGRAQATLMSGHRCTMFLNCVLNAAYLRIADPASYSSARIMHTGDDIVMKMSSLDPVSRLLAGCERIGLRMNPLKQSVGTHTAEFLRVAVRPKHATGYVMRAISSAVSGSWVNPEPLTSGEYLRTSVSNARTLINRGRDTAMAGLLLKATHRRTGVARKMLVSILSGRVALEGGPSFVTSRVYRSVAIINKNRPDDLPFFDLPTRATDAYLSLHVDPVEKYALELIESSPKNAMLDSSYRKTLTGGDQVERPCDYRLRELAMRSAYGWEHADRILKRSKTQRGLLSTYPVLALVKSRLRGSALRAVLFKVGWDGSGDPQVAAWGHEADGAILDGITSYADASALVHRTKAGVVRVEPPVYV